MTRSSDLMQASVALDSAGGYLKTSEDKLRILKNGVDSMVQGLEKSWESPESVFLQEQGQAVVPTLADALSAFAVCQQEVTELSRTAGLLAAELARYEAEMDAASATIRSLQSQLVALAGDDSGLAANLAQQIVVAQGEYDRAERAHQETVAVWRRAVQSAASSVESCRPPIQRLVHLSLLTPDADRTFDPFGLLGMGVPWADRGATAIQRGAMSYRGPQRFTHYTTEFHQRMTERQGHWVRPQDRTPYWRRGHTVRVGPRRQILRLSYVPNSAWYSARRVARRAGPAAAVLTFGGAGLGELNQARRDPSLSSSEQIARVAGATMIVGGASTGGAVLGMKGGAATGAFFGSFIPVPVLGTGGGAVVGGAVGAVFGSEFGGRVGSAFWSRMRGGADVIGNGVDWVGDRVGDVAGGAKNAVGGFIRWANPL